jgi:hypothetical protein
MKNEFCFWLRLAGGHSQGASTWRATLGLVGLEISQMVGRTLDWGRDRLSADWLIRPRNAAEQAATARLASRRMKAVPNAYLRDDGAGF